MLRFGDSVCDGAELEEKPVIAAVVTAVVVVVMPIARIPTRAVNRAPEPHFCAEI